MRRIYILLIPNDLQFEIKSCEILAPLQSDHSPIFLKFKSFDPRHWKFNNSLVNDATFIDEMQDLNEFDNPRINFEFLKSKIRNFTREYSINKTEERKSRREFLGTECVRLETKYATDSSEEIHQQHNTAKKKFMIISLKAKFLDLKQPFMRKEKSLQNIFSLWRKLTK